MSFRGEAEKSFLMQVNCDLNQPLRGEGMAKYVNAPRAKGDIHSQTPTIQASGFRV